MGSDIPYSMSTKSVAKRVNYHCPVCMESGNLPNLAGRFFIINLNECQCNGCNTVFPVNRIYKSDTVDKSIWSK